MKINIYTSYFAKMAKREKQINDCYVQVCRSVMPYHKKMIDEDWSGFAPLCKNLSDYEDEILQFPDLLKDFADWLKEDSWDFTEEEKKLGEFNIFLLCYENLESRYTKQDEEKNLKKGVTDIHAGEFKKCHRTILAEILNRDFGFNIKEY